MPTTYLVTGANRGLGFAFVQQLAQQPDTKIFATARDPAKADALNALAKEKGNVVVVQWRADVFEDAKAVGEAVKAQGVLDVFIANAGIAKNNSPVATADPAHIAEHITVNVSANIVLFQAVYPLLEASPRGGIYMPISSQIGSIGQGMAFPNFAYAMSKTALNFMAQKVSVEHEKIKVIIVHPGLVKTDMAIRGLAAVGMDIEKWDWPGVPVLLPAESAAKLLGLVERAESIKSGSFLSYDGSEIGW